MSKQALKKFSLTDKVGVSLTACTTPNLNPRVVLVSLQGFVEECLVLYVIQCCLIVQIGLE